MLRNIWCYDISYISHNFPKALIISFLPGFRLYDLLNFLIFLSDTGSYRLKEREPSRCYIGQNSIARTAIISLHPSRLLLYFFKCNYHTCVKFTSQSFVVILL
jgi:hypothetical protein